MNKPIIDCKPTILWKHTLMTGEWDFMDKQFVKEWCKECVNQSTCLAIIDLLNYNEYKTANETLFELLNKNEKSN